MSDNVTYINIYAFKVQLCEMFKFMAFYYMHNEHLPNKFSFSIRTQAHSHPTIEWHLK